MVVYSSPTTAFGGGDALRAFTAVGVVGDGPAYQVASAPDVAPFRRDVRWLAAAETPLAPLRGRLALTATPDWGYRLRAGLLGLTPEDARVIASAMGVGLPA